MQPDFKQLKKVLEKKTPQHPVLFELFLNDDLYTYLAGEDITNIEDEFSEYRTVIYAFKNAGYDYATVYGSDFVFPAGEIEKRKTISLNAGNAISDRDDFKAYNWPDPSDYDYSPLEKLKEILPEGMKLVVMGPGGVLENVIQLVGYEHLCYLTIDDPKLTADIFDAVGTRLLEYYRICLKYDTVGAIIGNDDWGFNTQTMLSPEDMKSYVFPWHKKIVQTAHKAGRLTILHSCGNLTPVMDVIIDDINYDAKHSFEDKIMPVEEAYERWGSRIAILGGLDVDFICRSTPEKIHRRAEKMLERSENKGSYALGTGNSVPKYVPRENYLAMIAAAGYTRL